MTWPAYIGAWLKAMWHVATSPLATVRQVNGFASDVRRDIKMMLKLLMDLYHRVDRIERHLRMDSMMERENRGKKRNALCSCESGKKYKHCCGKKRERGASHEGSETDDAAG